MNQHLDTPSKTIHSLLYATLLSHTDTSPPSVTYISTRLARWSLPFSQTAATYASILKPLRSLPPRVLWSFISLLLNGWIPARRMQRDGPCLFCGTGVDSIEHFRTAPRPRGAPSGKKIMISLCMLDAGEEGPYKPEASLHDLRR